VAKLPIFASLWGFNYAYNPLKTCLEFFEIRADTPAKGCPTKLEIGTFKESEGGSNGKQAV
jgi:hypothetical protein